MTEVGKSVAKGLGLKEGDKVAVQPTVCCWKCGSCKEGALNCCDNAGFVGLSGESIRADADELLLMITDQAVEVE